MINYKELLKIKGINQSTLSKLLKINSGDVSRAINGQRPFHQKHYAVLMKELGITLQELEENQIAWDKHIAERAGL